MAAHRQTILITGGAGFIGSNLAKRLVGEHELIILDNFHTGSLENLKPIQRHVRIINAPCREILGLDLPKPSFIFHIGIYSSSPMYKENPFLVGEVINDAIAIFEFARSRGVEKVIFASSSSIYNGLPLPFKEDMVPKVTDYYTEARLAVERIAKLYHSLYGVKSVGLRLFSVYGPGEEFKGRYMNVISQMLLNHEFTIYGGGNQTRDFVYVEDVVRAFMLAMEAELDCELINIGTGRETSFNEVARLISQIKPLKISYLPNPISNYVERTKADITLAREKLGWVPEIKLEDGIRKLYEYYSGRHGLKSSG